jgi:hypothetical protein
VCVCVCVSGEVLRIGSRWERQAEGGSRVREKVGQM